MVADATAVAVGGAIGALLRFAVARVSLELFGPGMPIATLFVNVIGSFLIGLLAARLATLADPTLARLQPLFVVGVLGAFTTFSTFSLETLALVEQGYVARALANVLANVVLCLGACALGLAMARTHVA